MKTLEQIIKVTSDKAPSDESAEPPRIAYVEFGQVELAKVLKPQAAKKIKRAEELLAGVLRIPKNKTVTVQREHLLQALGLMEDELADEEEDGPDKPAGGDAAGATTNVS